MNRYFLYFSFLGTNYHGWQVQPNAITVQSVMEEACLRVLREKTVLTGCGRTDAGVHARKFYAHFDLLQLLDTPDLEQIVHRLNACLPDDIVIHEMKKVDPLMHSRFSAVSRTYQYFIHTRKDPFLKSVSWFYPYGTLNLDKLNEAASLLLNYSDFACFSKKDTDIAGTQCALSESFWQQQDHRLVYTVSSNRFLRNMVRAIVGTLVEIGRGKWKLQLLDEIIQSGDRCKAGESVPACGLFLTNVMYPEGTWPDWKKAEAGPSRP